MVIHEGYENLAFTDPVVTLGIFDGVHSGHRKLLDHLVSCAGKTNSESIVITFHPHPRLILEKEIQKIFFLTTLEEKKTLMEKAGVDHLIIINFTQQFSRMKACDFIEKILVKKISTRYLIVGHDHHLGHSGEGNYDTIMRCARSFNFRVEKVEGFRTGKETVSSSLIREALLIGQLDAANKWLGYCYSLKGKVIEGKRLGRKLGFPTANIKPCDGNKLIPSDGVYAVEIMIDTGKLPGMLSIGRNPTVNKEPGTRSIEVNIFNFTDNIYEREIELIFRYRLRDEIKFDNTEQLARQMVKDKERAMQLLK